MSLDLFKVLGGMGPKKEMSPVIYFKWTSDMEIGHPEIDEQHTKLFMLGEAVVESLTNADEKKLTVAQLQAFIVFAQEHFKFEEGLMRSAGYPGADQHAKYHSSLLTELRTYCFKAQRGLHTNPVGRFFLWNWIVPHIDSADRDLVVWLKSHEPDGGG